MPLYKGTCHCNAVEFEVETDLAGGLQCDCSLCKRKNAVMHRVPKEQFRLVGPRADALPMEYARRRTLFLQALRHLHAPSAAHAADSIAVNVGCIDDVNARKLEITFAEGSKLSGGR